MIRSANCTRRAAGGFALGLAAAGVLYGAAGAQFGAAPFYPVMSALPLLLAGIIGGGSLASGGRRRVSPARQALVAALGLASGFLLTGLLLSIALPSDPPGDFAVLLVFVLRFALIGAWLGTLLAFVRRERMDLPRLAAAGAFGFGLGALLLDRIALLLLRPASLLVPGYIGDPLHDAVALALTMGIAFAAAGMAGGGILGYVLDHAQSPVLPLAPGRPAPAPDPASAV
ncbi:MAG: hypothetical protein ACM3JD_03055 [Rudaea sp.]